VNVGEPGDAGPSRWRQAALLRRRLRNPPAHWRLLGLCLVIIFVLIAFQGICTHTIGTSAEPHENSSASAPLRGSEPLLAARGGTLYSPEPSPGRQIALTFDDGPDPRWTPQVVSILRQFRIPGTFFMIGSQAARHPDVVRLVEASGGEIGDHTFTHTALSNGPVWERRAQIEFTEAVLLGITGHYPRFIRPPYSATPDAVTPADERDLAQLAGRRYLIALADYDSEDWTRPGVSKIVANATPRAGRGGIIMFHDGGGNRSETVAALRILIPRLRSAGYRFVAVRSLLGMSAAEAEPRASTWQHTRALAFLWAVRMAFWLTGVLGLIIVAVGVLVAARLIILLPTALLHAHRTRPRRTPDYWPSVAVIVPAFNEEVGIGRAVGSLAASTYPDLEIVVVDDGSTDRTAEIVEGLKLAQVELVRRPNGGKAAALTTGIHHTDAEVVVMVDGDTIFEADTITRLVQPLSDPHVAAVSGNTKVGNRSGLLGRWQHIEYVMGFNLDRRLYDVLRCMPTVPGAIGAFRRQTLRDVHGVSTDTLAEDTDLTMAICRAGWRVVYEPTALAWTEAPADLGQLWRQRYRWSYGTQQAMWKHRHAVFERGAAGSLGRRGLPYLLGFQVLLPLVAPVIDIAGLYGLLVQGGATVILTWLAFLGVQYVAAGYAFYLDREDPRPLWSLALQQIVYRQVMYLVVIQSVASAIYGARLHWQKLRRTGDLESAPV